MSDKYQKAVEYLTRYPEQIGGAWSEPLSHPSGCLFQFVTPSGKCQHDLYGLAYGCLTTIRDGFQAHTPELTAAIRADKRIPKCSSLITPRHLPVFAEWQARIDRELRFKTKNRLTAPQAHD